MDVELTDPDLDNLSAALRDEEEAEAWLNG